METTLTSDGRWPSGPVMVWDLAGRPTRATIKTEPVPGACAMCGSHTDVTLPTAKALGGNFTDQYLLARPDSHRVCYPCVWVCSGKPPDTVRMWTVLARPDMTVPASHPKAPFGTDHLWLTARNDMRAAVATLADPPGGPWLLSVAESGQKHHVPYARINHGGGRWTVRMDALDITATPAEFAHVIGHVLRLREAGFTATEIEHLAPTPVRLDSERLPVWRHHAEQITGWAGSPLIHLAIFLPNKEHMDEYVRVYGADQPGNTDSVGYQIPGRDAVSGGRRSDRPEQLVGPGADRPGDGDNQPHLF